MPATGQVMMRLWLRVELSTVSGISLLIGSWSGEADIPGLLLCSLRERQEGIIGIKTSSTSELGGISSPANVTWQSEDCCFGR
jgi:hypothetical protein